MDSKTDYRLMQVKSIAECSKGSILQYFQPTLSYHLSLRSFLSIFEWPLMTGIAVTENPIHAASSCTHMHICVHVGRPWLALENLQSCYSPVTSQLNHLVPYKTVWNRINRIMTADNKPILPFSILCLFDLILYVLSTIFQLCRDGSSWVEPVLS